jgi:hypothetical protein
MRRTLATGLALIAIAVAGCGGGGSGSGGSGPLDNALGYLPQSAPVVVAVDTNLNGGQWQALGATAKKFSFGPQIENQLKQQLNQQGLDFDTQIKPLLGNPAVIGSSDLKSFVIALEVKDKGKLGGLLKQSKDLKPDGSSNGATLYRQDDGGETALKDDVLLGADSKARLLEALAQRDKDDRLTEKQLDDALGDLPKSALLRVYANVQTLLARSPSTADARKIKWVGALRTLGVAGSATSSAISFDMNLKTDPAGLTEADVPIATGDDSPGVVGKPGELVFGLRGLNQVLTFAQSAAQTISPGSFGDFARAKALIGTQLGIDVDKDVIDQLSGNATVAVNLDGGYSVRIEPKDPAAFSKTLAKLAQVIPQFAGGVGLRNAHLTSSNGLYRLTGDNSKPIYFGVVGKVFALSTDPARIADLAAGTPAAVPGAKGSFVTSSNAGAIASTLISKLAGGGLAGSLGGSLVSAPLGNLDGWVGAGTSGLKGHFQLGIK